MKLKDLTGAIRGSETIEIVELRPFDLQQSEYRLNVVFTGTLFNYFESDIFKKYGNRNVLVITAVGKGHIEISIDREIK